MRLELRAENKTERFFLAIIFSLLSVLKMKQVYSAPQYLIKKKKISTNMKSIFYLIILIICINNLLNYL